MFKRHTLRLSLSLLTLALVLIQCTKDKFPVNGDPSKFAYLTEDYPPFNYNENGKLTGASVEILDSLFIRLEAGIDPTVVTVSDWGTAYQKVLNTPGTMLFSMVKTPETENLFKWVGPVASDNEVAIPLSKSGFAVKEVTDLNNYFIGMVDEYNNVDKLMSHGILRTNIIIYDNDDELYEALTGNREVQFIYTSDARHKKAILTLGYAADTFGLPFGVHSDYRYYAFNIETADEMINRFKDQLTLLKSSTSLDGGSVYTKILSRYNL